MNRGILTAGLLAFAALQISGQDVAKPPEFDAVSVKQYVPYTVPAQPGRPGRPSTRSGGGPCTLPNPGRLLCDGTSLRMLVAGAYGLPSYQVFGPDWLDSARFEIAAKIPEGATREQVNQMLKKLLADRFNMTTHRETREMQQYTLVVDKKGPKLKEFRGDSAGRQAKQGFREGQRWLEDDGVTMSGLANRLSSLMNQTVVDQTDLKGEYEIHLKYLPGEGMQRSHTTFTGPDGVPVPVGSTAVGPSIFSALQSQLGLKLEMKKLPTETIVVDSSDRTPTPN